MSSTLSPLRASLRTIAVAPSASFVACRSFQSTAPRAGTNPVTGGAVGSSMDEDSNDIAVKNAIWPIFMAVGVVGIGWFGYSSYSSAQLAKKEVHHAPHPGKQQTKNIPAGSQENQGTRG